MIVEWVVGRDWNQFSKILVYTLKFVLSLSVPHRMPSGQDALSLALCQTSLPRFVLPTRKQHVFESTSVDFLVFPNFRISAFRDPQIDVSGNLESPNRIIRIPPNPILGMQGPQHRIIWNSLGRNFRDVEVLELNYLEISRTQFWWV